MKKLEMRKNLESLSLEQLIDIGVAQNEKIDAIRGYLSGMNRKNISSMFSIMPRAEIIALILDTESRFNLDIIK